jgi:hypothetical protein
MENSRRSETKRRAFIFSVLFIGLVSLVQPGCDCSSSSGSAPPPPISSVYPPQDSDTALISTVVSATFSNDMNGTTIDSTTFFLTQGGVPVTPTMVTYDASTRTATLTPGADLTSGLEYRATITTAVQDINGGNPVTTDRVWSFTVSTSPALVSKDVNRVVGNNVSDTTDVDETGRYIVFESSATNLVTTSTTNGLTHIYRKDTLTDEVLLVSSTSGGLEANNSSATPRISNDGRYVVFSSTATNLGSIPGNTFAQIYIKDLDDDGSVDMISRDATLTPGDGNSLNPDISGDGSTVVFDSVASNFGGSTGVRRVYLVELAAPDTIEQISVSTGGTEGNGNSDFPTISDDGIRVVFESNSSNLDVIDSNTTADVYLRDRSSTGTTSLVSVDISGTTSGNAASVNAEISGDGGFVVFESGATNLTTNSSGFTDIFMRDLTLMTTSLVNFLETGSVLALGPSANASISIDGRYVTFDSAATNLDGGVNGFTNVFVRDNQTPDALMLVSKQSSGALSSDSSLVPSISGDGRYVGFESAFNFDITDTNSITDVYRVLNTTYQ